MGAGAVTGISEAVSHATTDQIESLFEEMPVELQAKVTRALAQSNTVGPCGEDIARQFTTRTAMIKEAAATASVRVEKVDCESVVRRNLVTGEWTLYKCSERDKKISKPNTYSAEQKGERTHERLQDDPRDPLGRQGRAMKEESFLTLFLPSDKTQWQVRCLRNGFPVLVSEGEACYSGDVHGERLELAAIGPQELIVQHCYNNMCLALMSHDECVNVWKATRARFLAMSRDSRVRYIAAFENHGSSSGGSLTHPHNQLVGLPYVPSLQRRYYETALDYFEQTGKSVFERLLEDFKTDRTRVVFENELFLCYVPWATERTHEMWVMPKRHRCTFIHDSFLHSENGEDDEKEVYCLAGAVRACLRMLYDLLADPDYNIVIRSAPCRFDDAPGGSDMVQEYYRWHVAILPCTTRGFRVWGTDCQVGKPEWWAEDLCGAAALRDALLDVGLLAKLTLAGLSEEHAAKLVEKVGESIQYLWKRDSTDALCSKLMGAGLSREISKEITEKLPMFDTRRKERQSQFVHSLEA